MKDKAQKIRDKVEKLKSQLLRGACSSQVTMETRCKEEAYDEVLAIIDTVQEESKQKFKVGDTLRHLHYGDKYIKTIVEIGEDYYKFDDCTILTFNAQDNWELVKEPKKCMYTKDDFTDEDRKVLCDGCEEECEYAQNQEPVSEDLEKAAIDICSKVLKGETIIIDGYECVVLSDAEECFKAGANWQKQQDQSTIELAEDHDMLAGMEKMKEEMMTKTVDTTIGLPYENKDGGYTHLVDVSRPLPVGNNKIAIIFKED